MTPFNKDFAVEIKEEIVELANALKLDKLEIVVDTVTERSGELGGLSYVTNTKKYITEYEDVKTAIMKEVAYDFKSFKRNYRFEYAKYVIGLFAYDDAIMTYSKSYGINLHDKKEVDSI